MMITRKSPLTGEETTLDLPVTEEQMALWNGPRHKRPLIQHLFHNLTPDQREFIQTGLLPEQWDAATKFAEDD